MIKTLQALESLETIWWASFRVELPTTDSKRKEMIGHQWQHRNVLHILFTRVYTWCSKWTWGTLPSYTSLQLFIIILCKEIRQCFIQHIYTEAIAYSIMYAGRTSNIWNLIHIFSGCSFTSHRSFRERRWVVTRPLILSDCAQNPH